MSLLVRSDTVSKINLGTWVDGGNAELDLDIVLESNLLVQAASGGGKSWLIRRLVEQTFKHVPICIIDIEDDFSSLREKFDFVLAGPNGETPIDVKTARLLARRMLELRMSIVCNLFELQPAMRRVWIREFFNALIEAPKSLWTHFLVFLDEAHLSAPEKEESVALGAVRDMAARGRKRGYGLVAATQRLGKFDKDAAAECKNVVIGQTFMDIDRDRAAASLGIGRGEARRAFDKEVKLLDPGQFYALGRALVREPRLFMSGAIQTTHPKAGQRGRLKPPPPTRAILHLLPQLADLPQEAETEIKTLEGFKAENARLVRELAAAKRAAPAAQPVEKLVEKVVVAPLPPELREISVSASKHVVDVDRELTALGKASGALYENANTIHKRLEALQRQYVMPLKTELVNLDRLVRHQPKAKLAAALAQQASSTSALKLSGTPVRTGASPSSDIGGAPQRMLEGLKLLGGRGSKRAVAALATIKASTGSFRTYLSTLRTAGFVTTEGDYMILTPAGSEQAGVLEIPGTVEGFFEMWAKHLGGTEREILRVLVDCGANSATSADIAEVVNNKRAGLDVATLSHETGSFRTYMSTLVANQLVDRVQPGVYQRADIWERLS